MCFNDSRARMNDRFFLLDLDLYIYFLIRIVSVFVVVISFHIQFVL